ncbi:lytic transglycosylase domain-containing protein [Nocardioides iriomotensis]|uniref:Lytic transglycosylase domain-containing protein n=1 Tax=Nocardioides iriomotensis TaxID=715784 RepID=A0A4Q5J6T5_9ACTN|nr:lytic transglycosylase domain-containing protein [Nocardioides iriomotensis]RYU14213.1 lytic transglycosylase domain-containing protein [Nocardioides iriomotensis]
MPRRDEYVPKHRGPAPEPSVKKGIKKTVMFSGVAVATTGIAVTSGVLAQQDAASEPAHAALRAAPQLDRDAAGTAGDSALAGRDAQAVSRGDRRTAVDQDKLASLGQTSGGQATRTEDLSDADPRDIARQLLPKYGFSQDQFSCLDALYMSESGWDPHADNPSSSAYGIPQALTETHDMPADYMTNPVTQIEWGLDYIRSSYGTPCAAWDFKQSNNWY